MQRHLARFWIPLSLLLLALPAAAKQPSILDDEAFREDARRGLDRLYDMDFEAANAVFRDIEQRYPGHPVGPFLLALAPWWEIQVDPDDEAHDEAFFGAMDEVIDRCDRRLRKDKSDIDAMFFKAGALAFRGRLHTDRKNWLRAARDGQRAMHYFDEVRKRDPENPDLLLGLGLFDYLVDVAPEKYPILKPFARWFPKGNRARGLQELTLAVERGKFVATEAAFSLVQINYVFERDYATALHYARWLRDRYPNNSLFHVYEGRTYARLNLWPDERQDLLDILERHAQGRTGYRGDVTQQALYVLGRDEVKRKVYDDGISHLSHLEILPNRGRTDSDYRAYGRLYRGMALDALGRRDEALYWYKRALGTRPPDEVKEKARNYLRDPYSG
ncbi:MAG TPA: tetratricopeptide repeat protein [Thermoanaerobaculia bacterium]|jgi:tetratricopeptide (TPR) repeat protein|nr:tetratricopeptide repeat protein [Thermoanaerobaculia bacterium]